MAPVIAAPTWPHSRHRLPRGGDRPLNLRTAHRRVHPRADAGQPRASLITTARSPRARCSTGPCAAPYFGARAGDGEACSLSTVIGHPFDPTDAGRLTNSKELQVGR